MAERPTTIDVERDFGIDELFFSRTDPRGIILAGNTVFQRVSGYEWDDLINAPHKIIRHPDMPRAVFWILWDRLKRGLPVGAYVKNRAQDGAYYWVFAMVTPVDGGFLSVRMRPSSLMFDAVQDVYAEALRLENEEGLDPEASFSKIAGMLAGHGFRDYVAFMARAIVMETCSRSTELKRSVPIETEKVLQLLESSAELLTKAAEVVQHFKHIRNFPINLRIQAQRVSKSTRIFAEISNDYDRFCREIEGQMNVFLDGSIDVANQIAESTFRYYTSMFQAEMAEVFKEDAGSPDSHGIEDEIEGLLQQAKEFRSMTSEALDATEKNVKKFSDTSKEVTWLVNGLDLARTLGMVETARLSDENNTLHKMMEEAGNFQSRILDHLATLHDLNTNVIRRTERMASSM